MLDRHVQRAFRISVRAGVPPRRIGYRWLESESVCDYFARRGADRGECDELIHPQATILNPLPRNVTTPIELPDERGWWGFAFRDVPKRLGGATRLTTCRDCRIVTYRNPGDGEFFPTIVNGDDRAFALREMQYRPRHAAELRQCGPVRRIERAVWIAERSYANHSHWLTAHLPKLLLAKTRSRLGDVVLPNPRQGSVAESMQLLGLDPGEFEQHHGTETLAVNELTFFETDRFRPELLNLVRDAFVPTPHTAPWRRIYVSRGYAARRRLENEAEIWPLLQSFGFERVFMERLGLAEQIELMKETKWLCAPHGAGLTNMIFCNRGTQVVEIADLSFPNPNFYALASAMEHGYWLVRAEGVGKASPLDRNMRVAPDALRAALSALSNE